MSTPGKTYKMAKGDRIDGIAKKNGINDWKIIWKDAQNARLVAKRGIPEDLQPGDVLFIPPNDQQRKMLKQAAESAASAHVAGAKALAAQVINLKKVISSYDRIIDDHQKMTEDVLDQLRKAQKDTKRVAQNVDLAKTFIDIGMTLGSLIKLGLKGSLEVGSELEKTNKEMIKEITQHLRGNTYDQAGKISGSLKDSLSNAVEVVAAIGDGWDKINSPSFWANTYMITLGGKKLTSWQTWKEFPDKWREAASAEIGDNIEELIKQTEQRKDRDLKRLRERRMELAKQLKVLEGVASESSLKAKQSSKEAAGIGLP